ncbi:MAG: cobalamin-dependent protein [Archangium sp.]|nr:cobalamin-dependent protein [Archangium sp.]
MDELSREFEQALLSVDRDGSQRVLLTLAQRPLSERLDGIVVPALDRIGKAWGAGAIALSQVYMAGRIVEELLSGLRPPRAPTRPPRVAIAVLEDHHLLGKRMVASILDASGVDVADLGRTTVDELVERVCAGGYEVVLVSVLMLPSALRVRVLVDQLASLGRDVAVIVGGAPFRLDPSLAQRVGARAFGVTASDAVQLVHRFLAAA